jgi:HAD superfamily hydrolase (TIGR01509 family)
MIRAVLFDLDGTLIDSTDAIVDSYFHTFDTVGVARPERQFIIDTIGHPLRKQFGMMTDHDVEECIRVYRAHYTAHACEKTSLLPGAAECLAAFQNRKLRQGFATSKKREAAEMLLAHLNVLEYMEVRVGPGDVSQPKPHPESLEKAMAELGVGPEETVFIGDMHFDILAGQAAGVTTYAVATGYASRSSLEALQPDGVFDTLLGAQDAVLKRL